MERRGRKFCVSPARARVSRGRRRGVTRNGCVATQKIAAPPACGRTTARPRDPGIVGSRSGEPGSPASKRLARGGRVLQGSGNSGGGSRRGRRRWRGSQAPRGPRPPGRAAAGSGRPPAGAGRRGPPAAAMRCVLQVRVRRRGVSAAARRPPPPALPSPAALAPPPHLQPAHHPPSPRFSKPARAERVGRGRGRGRGRDRAGHTLPRRRCRGRHPEVRTLGAGGGADGAGGAIAAAPAAVNQQAGAPADLLLPTQPPQTPRPPRPGTPSGSRASCCAAAPSPAPTAASRGTGM
jgi:hypothetical protein